MFYWTILICRAFGSNILWDKWKMSIFPSECLYQMRNTKSFHITGWQYANISPIALVHVNPNFLKPITKITIPPQKNWNNYRSIREVRKVNIWTESHIRHITVDVFLFSWKAMSFFWNEWDKNLPRSRCLEGKTLESPFRHLNTDVLASSLSFNQCLFSCFYYL